MDLVGGPLADDEADDVMHLDLNSARYSLRLHSSRHPHGGSSRPVRLPIIAPGKPWIGHWSHLHLISLRTPETKSLPPGQTIRINPPIINLYIHSQANTTKNHWKRTEWPSFIGVCYATSSHTYPICPNLHNQNPIPITFACVVSGAKISRARNSLLCKKVVCHKYTMRKKPSHINPRKPPPSPLTADILQV